MAEKPITHSVYFTLVHGSDTAETEAFLSDGGRILSSIPVVRNFRVVKQTSHKNDYRFGFVMEFPDKASYAAYNTHPSHLAFVRDRWEKEVKAFLEIDFEAYP
jgi:hypothetical protein